MAVVRGQRCNVVVVERLRRWVWMCVSGAVGWWCLPGGSWGDMLVVGGQRCDVADVGASRMLVAR